MSSSSSSPSQEDSNVARLPKRQRCDDEPMRLARSTEDSLAGTGNCVPDASSWPHHSASLNTCIEAMVRQEGKKTSTADEKEPATIKLFAPRISDYLAPGGTKRFRPRLEWLRPISSGRRKRPRTWQGEEVAAQPAPRNIVQQILARGRANPVQGEEGAAQPARRLIVQQIIARGRADRDQQDAPNNGLLPDNAFAEFLVAALVETNAEEEEANSEAVNPTESEIPTAEGGPIPHTFGRDHDSALHMAIRENATDAALELIQLGAPVSAENAKRVTPLVLASQKGPLEVVKELLFRGASPLTVTLTGSTSLLQAAHFGHLEVVRLLLDNGAMMEMANYKNTTPLMRASQEGREEVVQLLLSRGAKVNRRNNEHMSALMLASQRGHATIVDLLLKHKADVDAMTAQRSTSLMLACKREHISVVRVLVTFGCELYMKDSRGRAARDVATRKNSKALLKLLEPSKQIELMQRKSRVERNHVIAQMWTLLQQDRASVYTRNGNLSFCLSIHDMFANEKAVSIGTPDCEMALLRTLALPAPMVEHIASFMPLPRLWDERLMLITKRCGVDADAAISCAMDLIDEVLEEGGFLEACHTVNITPPTHFKSWGGWKSWGFTHNHLDPIPSTNAVRVNALTASLPGMPRLVVGGKGTDVLTPMNARDWRRGICYLQILAHRSPLLAKTLIEPPFNMPAWMVDQLITVNDIQTLSRRMGNRGTHFDASVAIELVMLASGVVAWHGR